MPRDLLEIDAARAAVLERTARTDPEPVPLREAAGRVLAEDVVAPEPVPAFDNSAMDGYALRAADTTAAGPESPVGLRLGGESRAGRPAEGAVGEGEAIAISTGAMVPAGADAVVRIEDTGRRAAESRCSPRWSRAATSAAPARTRGPGRRCCDRAPRSGRRSSA